MRYLILLPVILLIGCSVPGKPLSPDKSAIVKAAIETKWQAAIPAPAIADLNLAAETPRHEPTNAAPITINTKFAAACPYCQQVSISKACVHTGGNLNPDGSYLESWTINFVCPSCDMPFGDSRTQTIPQTQSVRLPIVGN